MLLLIFHLVIVSYFHLTRNLLILNIFFVFYFDTSQWNVFWSNFSFDSLQWYASQWTSDLFFSDSNWKSVQCLHLRGVDHAWLHDTRLVDNLLLWLHDLLLENLLSRNGGLIIGLWLSIIRRTTGWTRWTLFFIDWHSLDFILELIFIWFCF